MKTVYQKAFYNARLYKKISLPNFAKVLAVNKSFISRIENGKQKPSIDLIKKLERITSFSFWALAEGDFKLENQKKYEKISTTDFYTIKLNMNQMDVQERNYLSSKMNVEIRKMEKEIEKAKNKLSKNTQKYMLSKNELDILETEIEDLNNNLNHLIKTNAPAELINSQKNLLEKTESKLAEIKLKNKFISMVDLFLAQMMIEELEDKIKLREDKIKEIQAIV